MKYHLVLQWSGSSIADFDSMIEIEDALIARVKDGSKVDGHDAGKGEFNIFIHTDEPHLTFDIVKRVLKDQDALGDLRAAFRESAGAIYTILWPRELKEFAVA